MDKRIIFNSKEIRDMFFEKCLSYFQFKTWNEMAKFIKIRRTVLGNYRNGNLTLPASLYTKLIFKFTEDNKEFFLRNISFLEGNWGRVKGGNTTYNIHRQIFEEGRKKAILSFHKRAHKFDINIPLDKDLSYFIGLFIGDGFTNKYSRYYITQFTGDKKEKKFYETLIFDYCKKTFDIIPLIREAKVGNYIRVNIYSIDLFNLITERFKISAGRKSKTVLIPKEILKSDSAVIKSCIRGLYDAEGCVFFDKRQAYKKPYPRIDLHMNNLALLKQIYNLLNGFKIKCSLSTIEDNLRVLIYGESEVKKFVKEIGFYNPKHLEKLKNL